jgi:hypothetical protein
MILNKSPLVAAVVISVVSTGCGAGWRRADLQDGALKPRQQVQLWRAGKPTNWHAVVIRPDTVSAIPFMRPVGCDSCRVGMPRTEIDSMRLGNPVAGFWKTVGLAVGIPLAILVGVCIETGTWPNCVPSGDN